MEEQKLYRRVEIVLAIEYVQATDTHADYLLVTCSSVPVGVILPQCADVGRKMAHLLASEAADIATIIEGICDDELDDGDPDEG